MHRITIAACLAAVCLGASYAAPQDLVAHWSFDKGSGEVATDLTGHGHDATLKNVEWVQSPRGHALRFDSKDDLAQYGDVESMNLTGDITLAVWLKTDSSVEPKTNRIIFGDTGLGVERNLNLRMDGYGYLRFEWADGTRNASLLASSSLLNGTWKHVVVVGDSHAKLATMYVDGRQAARMSMPLPISKAPTRERLTGWFYNGYFQGDLDDIRLYSRALTPAQVTQLYQSEADLQIGRARALSDTSGAEPRAVVSVPVHNYSEQPCDIEVPAVPGLPAQRLRVQPGADAEIALGQVALQLVWRGRNDLLLCQAPPEGQKVTLTTHVEDLTEAVPVDVTAQLAIEPLQVDVTDPWQRDMKPGKTARLGVDVSLNIPAAQLRGGVLRVALASHETGETALNRQVESPKSHAQLALDVRSLPWGAYDMTVSFANAGGRKAVSVKRSATILPGGNEQVRVLNNLVSELMDARSRGMLDRQQIAFMNPRDGWVWFQAAGNCEVRLPSPPTPLPEGASDILGPGAGQQPVEAMRLLPAGRHVLTVSGQPTELVVRAIPGLLYNVYPSQSQIAPFGPNDWQRLSRYTLPNINMIEGQVIDTPEYREFVAQGKLWIANMQAPGLVDKEEWTPGKMLQAWRKPREWDLSEIAGIQSDEYYPGLRDEMILTTALSAARLAEDPDFAGKLWIPFVVRMYGNELAELFMKVTIGAGWPFSIEVYQGEAPTEQENREAIAARFKECGEGWEGAYPGSLRRAIFTLMYAYLPYCTTNCYPQADFRVHLDMQMQVLANDPAFFGLWGVQPYRSNYVDPEILDTMGLLLRHYCIDGETGPLLTDPYELKHVIDPDFEEGTQQWQLAPAEEAGAITAGEFAGYGRLQGRYPGGAFGDTFLVMKRSARAPNRFSQEMEGLQAGRLYSLKLITGDYEDLQAGTSRKDQQAVAIQVEGAQVQDGGFSYPFCSARGPAPFTTDNRFWMTYHWLQFRAESPAARLTVSDWSTPDAPGGPVGQEVMYSFVEVQPVLEQP